MRHLFQCRDELVEQVDEATQILLFLNYDGTLTPIVEIHGMPGGLPIFAGNDVTDEDDFGVLHNVGRISVFIGENNASSTADYYLDPPEQLYHCLEKLLEGDG